LNKSFASLPNSILSKNTNFPYKKVNIKLKK
jgi:hypothetical protein